MIAVIIFIQVFSLMIGSGLYLQRRGIILIFWDQKDASSTYIMLNPKDSNFLCWL